MTTCTNTKCGHKWQARVETPLQCPKCKRYLTASKTPACPEYCDGIGCHANEPYTAMIEGKERVVVTYHCKSFNGALKANTN